MPKSVIHFTPGYEPYSTTGKKRPASINFTPEMVKRIDELAQAGAFRSRTDYIVGLVRADLEERGITLTDDT